jgi:hypothetical protein
MWRNAPKAPVMAEGPTALEGMGNNASDAVEDNQDPEV